jgi:hypothetical protein
LSLLKLARGLKLDLGLDKAAADDILGSWYDINKPVVGDPDFDSVRIQFRVAWKCAKLPLRANPLESLSGEMPPEASAYDSDACRVTVALCWRLSRLDDGGKFYLGSYALAKVLGCNPKSAWDILATLADDGVITLDRRGTHGRSGGKANRYHWGPPVDDKPAEP